MNDRMAMANINMHASELGDFGRPRKTIPMAAKKNIALVAHDNKKDELLQWAKFNRKLLAAHSLYATGTTGSILTSQLGLDVVSAADPDAVQIRLRRRVHPRRH